MRIKKTELSILSQYIDVNNPKFELNYLYVDKSNAVSTNTRALAIFSHEQNVQNLFFVHRDLILRALKEKKAFSYELGQNKVICFDVDDFEILTLMIETDFCRDYKFPDYLRIQPKDKHKLYFPFTDNSQISGIVATKKTTLDPKWIPASIKSGLIGWNKPSLPVQIQDEEMNIEVIIMPIVDNRFKELEVS